MNNQHGKSSSGQGFSNSNSNNNKEPKKAQDSGKSPNYATDMWHKIENSVARDKRSNLKGVVNQQQAGEGAYRRPRRRHKREEPHPDKDPKASSLPTQDHEARYQEELKENDFLEKIKQKKEDETIVSETEIIEEGEPINPFEVESKPRPLDNRPLDERSLDEVGKVDKTEAAFYDEEKSADELGEAKEAQAPGLEGVVTPQPVLEREDLHFNPKEELQEQAKSEPQKIIEVRAEEDKSELIKNVDAEMAATREDFWTIMEQAGITKRKAFLIVLVILVLLIGVLIYVFGWYKYLFFWRDNEAVQRVEEVGQEAVVDDIEEDGIGQEMKPYDVISSYIFGLEYSEDGEPLVAEPISKFGSSAGFEAAFVFGENVDLKEERYVEYVELLLKMKNIYELDVYALLNQAVDRRGALSAYLSQFKDLIDQGSLVQEALEQDLIDLDGRYEFLGAQSSQYETDFFAFLEADLGRAAYDTLQLFVESSQEAAEVKANFSAEKVLRDRFVELLNFLRPRYQDVLVNEEALIKGIKVFDVPKSNIEAIVPVEEVK